MSPFYHDLSMYALGIVSGVCLTMFFKALWRDIKWDRAIEHRNKENQAAIAAHGKTGAT